MKFYKVSKITPMKGFMLKAVFETGETKLYDVKQLPVRYPVFRELLEDVELFLMVRVDPGGYGISWNDYLDLSCNELYKNGLPEAE